VTEEVTDEGEGLARRCQRTGERGEDETVRNGASGREHPTYDEKAGMLDVPAWWMPQWHRPLKIQDQRDLASLAKSLRHGTIRIHTYETTGDADDFIMEWLLELSRPKSLTRLT
jgi:hypothetical protein